MLPYFPLYRAVLSERRPIWRMGAIDISTLLVALHHIVVHPQLPLSQSLRNFMPLPYPKVPRPAQPAEPEHAIEQSNVELCVISGKGELRCRDPPLVIRQGRGNCVVFVSFVAVPKQVGS